MFSSRFTVRQLKDRLRNCTQVRADPPKSLPNNVLSLVLFKAQLLYTVYAGSPLTEPLTLQSLRNCNLSLLYYFC